MYGQKSKLCDSKGHPITSMQQFLFVCFVVYLLFCFGEVVRVEGWSEGIGRRVGSGFMMWIDTELKQKQRQKYRKCIFYMKTEKLRIKSNLTIVLS